MGKWSSNQETRVWFLNKQGRKGYVKCVCSKMSRAQMLLKCQASLQCQLEKVDLLKFSRDLLKYMVWSKVADDKFSTLDPDLDHLEAEVKVRYLLQRVYEIVREDDNVYDKLMNVFRKHRVKVGALHEVMGRDIENVEESEADRGEVEDVELVEQDVSGLVEVLVSGSYLWENIGIALNLPKNKRDNCGEGKDNVIRLTNILTTWILGSYEGARPATLTSLREALASEIVGLGKLALELMTYKGFVDSLPITKKPRLHLDITYRSYDTEVAEDKSTLLEVQISNSGCECYQWSKDGQPLLDGTDFSGVCNILYINRASQCIEGKYSCCISRDRETVFCEDIIVSVIYPPEKKKLLEFYSLTEREVPQNSWPPVSNSTFINLVLIKQKQKSMSKCDYYTVRGDMDDILESKEEVIYEEVFRGYKEGALVLVEGRPGSGKTTLVHKLTKDWATGKKVLQGAKMVFLVTLRLVNVSGRDKTLLDLLQIFYGETLSKSIEHDLQECRGKGACFILDGLDEYPLKSKKNLIIDQLLFTKTFPHSMVIVASRPVATQDLKKYCKTRIEVIGFSKDQIYDYVKSYPFSESPVDMAYKMAMFLDKHPNVLHTCYLPVHASIICFLFGDREGDIPHRETLIYEQFTIATLLKHKALKGEQLQLRSLEDLSGEDKTLFNSLCKLAFDMIVNSQQVVSKSDAKISLDSALELLTIEQTSKSYGREDFYSFSHLTFQEFLAAYYIREAQLEDENLVDRISKNVWKFYSGLSKSLENITFLKLILKQSFYFGYYFKYQCGYESQQAELCDYVVKDEVVLVTDNTTSTDLIALGYVISKSNKLVNSIEWRSDYSDCEGVKLFVSMATHRKLQSIRSLNVKWCYTSEAFKAINCLLVHLPFLEKLDMSYVPLDKCKIECLTSKVTLPHLKVLNISLPLLPCSHPEEILKLLAFNSKCMSQVLYSVDKDEHIDLVFWHKIIQCAFGSQIIQDRHKSWLHLLNLENYNLSLHHERFSHCVDVVLINCCIGDEGAEILANSLNTSVLENLVLYFNRISDAGIVALADCLARCSVVREVSIQCNSIGDSGATVLADAVGRCSSLRRLDLQGNSLGDKGAVALAEATTSLPSLDMYLHNVNITEEGIERVLEHRAETSIRGMEFTSSWKSVSETDIDTLKRALYCGNLPALFLSKSNISLIKELVTELDCVKNVSGIKCKNNCISEDTVPTLCSIINHLPGLHQIELLFFNDISSTGAQQLSNCLKTCESMHSLTLDKSYFSVLDIVSVCSKLKSLSLNGAIDSFDVGLLFSNHESWINLRTLKLYGCSIGSDGAQVLSKMLIHCNKLQYLSLPGNDIGDSGALAIAEGLKDNTSLLTLDMRDNDITSEGMAGLCQVINCNHLHSLNLSRNSVANSVPALMDGLCGDNLQTLYLEAVGLGVDGIASLSDGLKKCTQLIKLDVSRNHIESRGVEYLAEGLQYCTKLQELRLSNCNITSDGVTALCSIMKSCKYLRRLDLSDNRHIGIDGAAILVGGWQHKSVLELSISECDDPHDSALRNGEKCCSKCDHLLELYHKNDYIHIPFVPKCVAIS